MEGLECQNWSDMSVMDTIFGRWELAVADKVYGSNVGAQTYNTYRYIYTFISEDSFFFCI
jgi:hypothetical protein